MGFMVGFYILRVERTMGGLGEKFEEALMAILPKAASYAVREETLDPPPPPPPPPPGGGGGGGGVESLSADNVASGATSGARRPRRHVAETRTAAALLRVADRLDRDQRTVLALYALSQIGNRLVRTDQLAHRCFELVRRATAAPCC